MLKNGLIAALIIVFALVLHKAAFASEVISLPPEELAQESVLPVFDKPVSVKNRNVVTEGRFVVDVFYGYAMTEPIANVSKLGIGIYYNTSEANAWGLLIAKNFSGLSSYAEQLEGQFSNLRFGPAPYPEMTIMGDYNLKAFYGKMSLTKSLVFNTVLYGSASLGAVKYVHKTYPAVAFGIGQKFYFTNQWAFRFDLRLYAHQAPIPFIQIIQNSNTNRPYEDYQERLTFTTNLDAGLSYLF